MSWLFGMGSGGQGPPQVPLPPSGGDANDGSTPQKPLTKSEMEAYRFDSAALERAAKAAKELEGSSKSAINRNSKCSWFRSYRVKKGVAILNPRAMCFLM